MSKNILHEEFSILKLIGDLSCYFPFHHRKWFHLGNHLSWLQILEA